MIIGKLNVMLGLQSAQFDRGTQKAGTRVKTLGTEVRTTASFMPRLRAGLMAGAAAAAAAGAAAAAAAYTGFRILRTEMERLDKIGKTAQKLGLMPEALVGLQHAANLAGVEQNKLDMAVQRMTRRLSEAAKGAGEAQGALAEMNLDAARLASLAPDMALMEIADAMAGVANQGDRVRLAFKLFDAEGVDLVRMMEGGSAAIRQAMQDAEDLGMTFSQLDHQKVAMANDAMMRLEQSTGALKRQLAIEFAPLFTVVAETITEGMIDATAAVNDHTAAVAEAGKSYGLIAESVFFLADVIDNLGKGVTALNLKVMDMMVTVLKARKSLAEFLGQDTSGLQAGIDSLQASMAKLAIPLGVDIALDESLGDKMRKRYQEILDDVGKASTAGTPLVDLDEMKTMEALQRKGEALTASLRTPSEVLVDSIRDANKMLDMGAISWQTYGREIAAVRAEFQRTMDIFDSKTAGSYEWGSHAAQEVIDRTRAMTEAANRPLPGDDLVKQPAPKIIDFRPIDMEPTPKLPALDVPRPPLLGDEAALPNMDLGRISMIPRLGRRSEQDLLGRVPNRITDVTPEPAATGASRLPRSGRDSEMARELQQLNVKTDQVVDRLEKIAAETGLTTNATSRTANATERIESNPMETVEM